MRSQCQQILESSSDSEGAFAVVKEASCELQKGNWTYQA
jgi:hypothetical protein